MVAGHILKKVCAFGFGLSLCCSVAYAGGAFEELPPQWAGGYAGLHGGYIGEADIDGIFDSADTANNDTERLFLEDLDVEGGVLGVHVGYLWQGRNNIVFGVEGDFSAAIADDRIKDIENDSPGLGDGQDSAKIDLEYIATLRARLGVASDSLLVYATGGLAYANAEYKATNATRPGEDNEGSVPVGSGTTDIDDVGYVVGGGVEKAFNESGLRVRVEGLYYGFDEEKDTDTLTPDSDPEDFVGLDGLWSVRVGLSVPFQK